MRQLLKITATFALALVFTAGTAFGQNFVDLDQSDGSTANINQVVGNGSNTVEGLRGGSISSGDAFTQEGGSSLKATQKVFGGSASHLIEGEQEGSGHTITALQVGKSGQSATIDQTGSNNVARTWQKTGQSGVNGNRANVKQQGGDKLLGSIQASGTVNFTQAHPQARQVGVDNFLNIRQRAGSNKLYSQQLGDENDIAMNQKFSSVAEVLQDGSNNSVAKNKSGNGIFQSRNAELYVQQTGSGNSVYGGQTNNSVTSTAYIVQDGMTNTARLVQQ